MGGKSLPRFTVGNRFLVHYLKIFRSKDGLPLETDGEKESCSWASEASPTLGCSIEISRDIYVIGSEKRGTSSKN